MKSIPLKTGDVALIDDQDLNLIQGYTWTRNADGYVVSYTKGYVLFMHTLIMGAKGIDHIDCNLLNNQRQNLRIATTEQNMQNRRKWNKSGTHAHASKYKGVSLTKSKKKWQAIIKSEGKLKYLGSFSTEEEAALAWDNAAREIHSEFARLNFPRKGEQEALG